MNETVREPRHPTRRRYLVATLAGMAGAALQFYHGVTVGFELKPRGVTFVSVAVLPATDDRILPPGQIVRACGVGPVGTRMSVLYQTRRGKLVALEYRLWYFYLPRWP